MYVKLCVADCWRDPFIARENVRGGQLVSRELNIGSRGRFDDDGKPERGTSLRQCDPELAESRSILGSLSCPPTLSTPPPPSTISTTTFFLCFLSGLFWSLNWRGTVKPQGAFREDPVTRALALSSALTKSATEREQTRALRKTALRRPYTALPTNPPPLDRYLDILPPCLSTCPPSPPNIFLSLSPVASPTLFTPISPKRYLHRSVRSRLPSKPRFIAQISIASCPSATPVWKGL